MKTNMKKAVSLALAAAMALGTTACGSKGSSEGQIDTSVTNFRIFAGISALSPDNSEKPVIQQEPEWKDTLPMFGASKVPEREGHGYEYPVSFNTSNVGGWFTNLVRGL